MSETDVFEHAAVIKAPRARVWKALSDATEFGTWFGVALNEPFVAGTDVTGKITNPPGFDHVQVLMRIERVEAGTLLAFRWHPFAIERAVDYSAEPMTLIEMRLEDAPGGHTKLTIRESGFDKLPPARRGPAFGANSRGWQEQLRRIARHVES